MPVISLEDAQLAVVANACAALDRAKAFEAQLGRHLAGLSDRIKSSEKNHSDAVIGTVKTDIMSDLPAHRAEAAAVAKQHRRAVKALAQVQAEHDRHAADLAAMFDTSAEARQRLAQAHEAHRGAVGTQKASKAVLARAVGYEEGLQAQLAAARAAERLHEEAEASKLHAALRAGSNVIDAAPLKRQSASLEENVRIARLAVTHLEKDCGRVQAALASAENSLNLAVEAVMQAEAERVARELLALRARDAALSAQLRGYANHQPQWRTGKGPAMSPARPMSPGSLVLVRDPILPAAPLRHWQTPVVLAAMAAPTAAAFAIGEGPTMDFEPWRALERTLLEQPAEPASTPTLTTSRAA